MGTSIEDVFSNPQDSPYIDKIILSPEQEPLGFSTETGQDFNKTLKAMEERLGCRLSGKLEIYKAPGYIKIYLQNILVNYLLQQANKQVDLSHRINKLRYGTQFEE
jgi:hypothetical protein